MTTSTRPRMLERCKDCDDLRISHGARGCKADKCWSLYYGGPCKKFRAKARPSRERADVPEEEWDPLPYEQGTLW